MIDIRKLWQKGKEWTISYWWQKLAYISGWIMIAWFLFGVFINILRILAN